MPREITVTVIVPDEDAATDDDAIDAVGERLKPWYWVGALPRKGHDLGRAIIKKHGVDRFPTIASNYRHLADEMGELAEALMLWHASHGRDLDAAAKIRKEYGDVGLTLYTLGDKLLLDLDQCMAEVVENETRTFT